MTKRILALGGLAGIAMIALAAYAKRKETPLETVPYVDVEKYMGIWYEIASFPQQFQKGCHCTKAEYTLNKKEGFVEVKNSCRKNGADGKLDEATGKATIADKKTNAKLEVEFFWPFKGKYWIIELASDYSYAVVGHPNREYLWILSRTPKMDTATYDMLTAAAKAKGFNLKKLQKTDQSCVG